MPKRGVNIHYGASFDTLDDKELVRSLVNNISDKTNLNAGDIIKNAMIEYNKTFDDKGNRI